MSVFEQYFGMGMPEQASPFLSPSSRKWASQLTLKAALLATVILILAFAFSFDTNYFFLSSLLTLMVYFLAGIPSLIEAIEDLANLNINIDVLMTLAAFSSVLIGSSLEGALLLVLFALSGAIEDAVTAKAKNSINQLHQLTPKIATVITSSGDYSERSVKDLTPGTDILIRAGEIVPLDGVVVQGVSSLNLAHITGESQPLQKKPGDEVPAGARNLDGAMIVKVIRNNADSTLARIVGLITSAQEAKPLLQSWFDRISSTYALAIISLAGILALILPFLLGIPYLGRHGSIYRAVAFLIAASPCALILALPIAYLSAISSCAKKGIILKGGIILDALDRCKILAFDKTGTLTTGKLKCLGFERIGDDSNRSMEEVFSIAYTLEQNAFHPIAEAIVSEAQSLNLNPITSYAFTSLPGFGIQAKIDNKTIFMGQPDYVIERAPQNLSRLLKAKSDQFKKENAILAALWIGNEIYLFSFQDTLRPNLRDEISTLAKEKKIVMLTGDHFDNAKKIADELGIQIFYYDLKPENKLQYVADMSDQEGLAMVGDGINDAPALTRATVGIAMGQAGSATAVEAADVILLHDNIEKLGWLFKKATLTQKIVLQNLIIAIGAIIIAVFPSIIGLIPLWLAVVLHEGGTVLVGLNALRLYR